MTTKRTSESKDAEIRSHWEDAASHLYDVQGLKRTGRDHDLQGAIEDAMLSYLTPGQSLMDVGCGDGASAALFARKTGGRVVLVDYTERFVEQAAARLAGEGHRDVVALQGDVRELRALLRGVLPVDVAVSIRCLINLPSAEEQLDAAEQIVEHLNPGGLYMCSEGWAESWAALDAMRMRCGLEKMFLVEHNLLIVREELIRRLAPKAELVGYESLGFYTFLSRVLQPMVTAPEPPRHLHPINTMARKLVALGIRPAEFDELGFPGVCVFKRKSGA